LPSPTARPIKKKRSTADRKTVLKDTQKKIRILKKKKPDMNLSIKIVERSTKNDPAVIVSATKGFWEKKKKKKKKPNKIH